MLSPKLNTCIDQRNKRSRVSGFEFQTQGFPILLHDQSSNDGDNGQLQLLVVARIQFDGVVLVRDVGMIRKRAFLDVDNPRAGPEA